MSKITKQVAVNATYMRGGTSKGVFFLKEDLPMQAQSSGEARDRFLLRVIGSPDPYGKHTDGMGGATSSTSKTVILSKSEKTSHDVDYLFGQVAIDKPFVDWGGNCGNLTAAVGAFAVRKGLVSPDRIPRDGICEVRIWQANIKKTIVAHVPMVEGDVAECGDFELDGVTFPAAETRIDFLDPAAQGALFPTGNLVDTLEVPTHLNASGTIKATLINAGIPTIFFEADSFGLTGTELQIDINTNAELLERFEQLRALGGVKMGLLASIDDAKTSQHVPKIAFVSPAQSYQSSSGTTVSADEIDVNVRALSMGKLHHAMMGTAAVAIASAAVIPGTLVNKACGSFAGQQVTFGHPSGTLKVGAIAKEASGAWTIDSVSMSRSARVLMEGQVFVPSDSF